VEQVWEAAEHRIRVRGHLDESWGEWFGGLQVRRDVGDRSSLVGMIRDQAELHGILARIRDLGLVLISVERVAAGGDPATNPPGVSENAKSPAT
jgi:hypothetical protein